MTRSFFIILATLVAVLCAVAPLRANPNSQIFGIGLNSSATVIESLLTQAADFQEKSERIYPSGAVERRYWLERASFLISFPDVEPETMPRFIQATVDENAVALVTSFTEPLGHPDWRSDSGDELRQIWGGKGFPTGAIRPKPGAVTVVEVRSSNERDTTVTIAVPSWFQKGGN